MEYLIPLAIFAALGILAGVLLTVASKVFAVEVDERVDAIAEALPQANATVDFWFVAFQAVQTMPALS